MTDRVKLAKTTPYRNQTTVFSIMAIFLLCLLLKNAEIAVDYMRAGLRLCASTVIPSLFPFMVISELLVASGIGNRLGNILGGATKRMFGVSADAVPAILLGALCGFPVGAKTAISLYDSNRLSRREVERLLTFCNTPSPGFLISAVGVSLFGNRSFGVFLFFAALLFSLLCGGILQRIFPISPPKKLVSTDSCYSPPSLTHALSSATASMLSVCACVIFFTSIIGCFSHAVGALGLSQRLEALLFCIFEISSGVSAAAEDVSPARLALCGFAVGWSGISVHFQILSLGAARGISFAPYLLSKGLQGLLLAATAYFYGSHIAPELLDVSASLMLPRNSENIRFPLSVCIFFTICVLLYVKKGRRS